MTKSIIALLGMFLASAAFAEPKYQEHNYKLSHEDHYATYRHTNLDTWHVEYGNKVTPWLDITYRYADLNITKENRIKFTVPVWRKGNFNIKSRMEFRSFDNKEDHWRGRFIFGYKHNISDHAQAWIKLQPRLAFKDSGAKFDSRDQIGVKFHHNGWSISPFYERYSKDDISNTPLTVFGTYFQYKF